MSPTIPPTTCDVAIIGGGPSGLAAATELKKLGVKKVVILEREPHTGGIPRHCGHPPFGMREFKRVYTGPTYAKNLSKRAKQAGVLIFSNTTVSAIGQGGTLEISTLNGLQTLTASRVIISTGIRETPRATRLISGQRPLGITTTGALQSTVYLQNKIPFKRPVIIGTELVAFSALLTCRHANIKPAAMLEENTRITARLGSQLLAKALGVPIHLNTQLHRIIGTQSVEGIEIKTVDGNLHAIKCDGVVLTGKFIAESSLLRASHLILDPQTGMPIIDQFGRCSDPVFFATGNMTHPVETAGHCWQNGVDTAQHVYASLSGLYDQYQHKVSIMANHQNLKYCVPQMISLDTNGELGLSKSTPQIKLQLRVNQKYKGVLVFRSKERVLARQSIYALPERRIEIGLPTLDKNEAGAAYHVTLEE